MSLVVFRTAYQWMQRQDTRDVSLVVFRTACQWMQRQDTRDVSLVVFRTAYQWMQRQDTRDVSLHLISLFSSSNMSCMGGYTNTHCGHVTPTGLHQGFVWLTTSPSPPPSLLLSLLSFNGGGAPTVRGGHVLPLFSCMITTMVYLSG